MKAGWPARPAAARGDTMQAMNIHTRYVLAAAVVAGLSACSNKILYDSAQATQQQECQKLQDPNDRARCLQSNAMSYERYRTEAEAAKKPPSR